MRAPTHKFSYASLDELTADMASLGLALPVSHDLSILARPLAWGRMTVPNRFCAQPMEGCDGSPDGSPGELTVRRYRRIAAGGSGLIWVEACAVTPAGRANPRQLWLHAGNVAAYRSLVDDIRRAARDAMGHEPAVVLQLTHSGRYSRPVDKPAPVIAHHSPVLDPRANLPPDYPLVTDDELDRLQDDFVTAAKLAADAGFDGVDIKGCHRYLLGELLASLTRQGRYGGPYENRTRMLRQTIARVRAAVGDRLEVTTRVNAYDAIEHPYGWGVSQHDAMTPDLAEPIRLLRELVADGLRGVNITIANPYFNPHVNRPADTMIAGWPTPPERPAVGLARIIAIVRDVASAVGDVPVVGSGYTWLRELYPQVAAGVVGAGWAAMAGVGRMVFAYPDYARDILRTGRLDPAKTCTTCSGCTQLMRYHTTSGCIIRDAAVYGPILRQARQVHGA
jgi:2,4-dienoyl-CoA reductase-like NADH-dependent reductase (Old Yellow Enzyme family)